MKKLIILTLAVLLAIPSTAQIYKRYEPSRYHREGSEHYFGLRLGLNLSSISSENVDIDADYLAGLYLGGVYGIQLAYRAPVWLDLGLGYSEKGGIARPEGYKMKYRLSYLEAPIAVKYSFDVSDFRIQPFLGGYLAVGIMGKIKDYRLHDASKSTFDSFRRFDGGLRLGCGAEYRMLYLEVGFDFGLANISKDDFDTARNRCFFFNAGVNF